MEGAILCVWGGVNCDIFLTASIVQRTMGLQITLHCVQKPIYLSSFLGCLQVCAIVNIFAHTSWYVEKLLFGKTFVRRIVK